MIPVCQSWVSLKCRPDDGWKKVDEKMWILRSTLDQNQMAKIQLSIITRVCSTFTTLEKHQGDLKVSARERIYMNATEIKGFVQQ